MERGKRKRMRILLPDGGMNMEGLIQVKVLERKEKQQDGMEVYLGLLADSPIIRRGEEIRADEMEPGDIVWFKDEPLKVVSIRPWPPEEKEETDGRNKDRQAEGG